eukprot:TRINITY_DN1064_c0_g1_i1.p1 TRINITY_DN1064_c0_g1~~TRINITY_DN1064_c0_g1_i1.p1  ORF type:complete len:539 (-),score=135.57 TRINITY_DN1064_c0_g1_i1:601-2217(-)
MLSVITTAVVLAIVLRCMYILWHQHTSRLDCPGPYEAPLFGQATTMLRGYNRLYDLLCEMRQQFGNAFQLYLPGQPRLLVVTDPKDVECVLKTDFDSFEKGEPFRDRFTELLGNGIFNADGKQWYEQRKTAVHMFSVRQFRDHSLHAFLQHGKTMVEVLRRHQQGGKPVDAQQVFYKYTLDSIGTIGFGKDLGCLLHERVEFADDFDYAQAVLDARFFTTLWPVRKWLLPSEYKFRWCVRKLDRFARGLVRERSRLPAEELAKRHDFLSLFMAGTTEVAADGTRTMPPQVETYLRDVVLNFLIAGRDTTAGALTWTTWCLAEHPAIRDRCRAEVREVLHANGETPQTLSYDTVWKHMPLLHAVCHEVLRLYPSVPKDAKMCVKDTTLPSGVVVRKNTMIAYVPYVMGRMVSIWGPDAAQFNPDRWLSTTTGNPAAPAAPAAAVAAEDTSSVLGDDVPLAGGAVTFQKRNQFEYPVFNAGPRLCLGMNMALLELKVALVLLLSEFSLDVVPCHVVTYHNTLTMPMRHGLKVTVKPAPTA